MNKKVLLGTEIFDELITGNGYYVDKTELIYELVEETGNKVTLFTRPRRFGKTLTMKMLESFFSSRKDSKDVFSGLDISERHPEFCAEWMNQYPVLFISLKDVEGLRFEDAYAMLKNRISVKCSELAASMKNAGITERDRQCFERLQSETGSLSDVKSSLETIMRMIHAAYGRQVILLIDEYDVPLDKAQSNGYYNQMLDVIRGIMSTALKTNDYLKFAVVTGCLRISKESIFTGVNNFASYSVLDEDFSQYFGFTPEEVEEMLKYYNREDKKQITAAWYDGYLFGKTEIYCPWDVVSYAGALRKRKSAKPEPYWENTSGNGAIAAFFELGNDDVFDKFETLLNGGVITETVTNALTYNEVYDSEQGLWSVLLMTGYLTAVHQDEPEEDDDDVESPRTVDLRIPNREIARIFQRTVVDHFNRTVDQGRIDELMKVLWNGDADRASEILSDLLFETISYMDYHEDYYHAFVAGIFTGRGYVPKSNKERGLGRPDVDLRDRRNRRAMIIEIKKAAEGEDLDKASQDGIDQIVEKQYAKNMNGYNNVLCYGLGFLQKSAKFKLLQ